NAAMTATRFLPDIERTRRGVGLFFTALAAPLLTWLIYRIVQAQRLNITGFVLLLIGGGFLALGLRLWFHLPVFLEIDLESRTFNVVRNGVKQGGGPLDSLGPLSVKFRTRVTGTGSDR